MPALNQPALRSISAVFSKTEEIVDFTHLYYWHYYRPHAGRQKERFLMGSYFIAGSTMWLVCPKGQRLPKAVKDFAKLLSYEPQRPKTTTNFYGC